MLISMDDEISVLLLEICLATIGVCVFRCDSFGCRTFYLRRNFFTKKEKRKMFENKPDYNCEQTIKKWAKAFYVIGIVLISLSILVGIILMCKSEYLLTIGLIVAAGGITSGICAIFGAHITWGFGDIVGNTKKIANGTTSNTTAPATEDELPEI